jgi:hypothetical protein
MSILHFQNTYPRREGKGCVPRCASVGAKEDLRTLHTGGWPRTPFSPKGEVVFHSFFHGRETSHMEDMARVRPARVGVCWERGGASSAGASSHLNMFWVHKHELVRFASGTSHSHQASSGMRLDDHMSDVSRQAHLLGALPLQPRHAQRRRRRPHAGREAVGGSRLSIQFDWGERISDARMRDDRCYRRGGSDIGDGRSTKTAEKGIGSLQSLATQPPRPMQPLPSRRPPRQHRSARASS